MSSIVPHNEYSPLDITKGGWIKNTRNKADYKHILRLIRQGKLPARNVCLTGHTYFRVLGAEILRYQERV